jgi:hypothetical protein
MHFSTLDARVLDWLAPEKQRMYPLCRPGVNAPKAAFKAGISSQGRMQLVRQFVCLNRNRNETCRVDCDMRENVGP